MILLVDHYDSFTWNLVQAVETLGESVEVVRHDRLDPEGVGRRSPRALILSPGPKSPREATGTAELVRRYGPDLPILGVCLGHQCIADAFGAKVVRGRPFHGKTSDVRHDAKGVFAGLANPMSAMRYHSLVVDETTLPAELEISARTDDGEVMGLRHRTWPLEGVQFHPESYRTPAGLELLRNFLRR